MPVTEEMQAADDSSKLRQESRRLCQSTRVDNTISNFLSVCCHPNCLAPSKPPGSCLPVVWLRVGFIVLSQGHRVAVPVDKPDWSRSKECLVSSPLSQAPVSQVPGFAICELAKLSKIRILWSRKERGTKGHMGKKAEELARKLKSRD